MATESPRYCMKRGSQGFIAVCVVTTIAMATIMASTYFQTGRQLTKLVIFGDQKNGHFSSRASLDLRALQTAYDSLVQARDIKKDTKKVTALINRALYMIDKYLPAQKASNKSIGKKPGIDVGKVKKITHVNISVTVLFNFVKHPLLKNMLSTKLWQNLARLHGTVHVITAVSRSSDRKTFKGLPNISVMEFEQSVKSGVIWNSMIKASKTPYIFLARDMMFFDEHSRFQRLLDMLLAKDTTGVVGGAYRYLGGHWFMGCQQYVIRNYTLSYKGGYLSSYKSCVYCQYVDGPFMAKTPLMQSLPFEETFISEQTMFADFFLRLDTQQKGKSMVCPDAMFHVNNHTDYSREAWTPFARKWELNVIKIGSRRIPLRCSDLPASCNKYSGRGLSPCCMKDIADQIKFLVKTCTKHNIATSLNAGTMLGAIKFGGILPWELDADVSFARENASAVLAASFLNYIKGKGYKVINYTNKKRAHIDLHKKGSSWKLEFNGFYNYSYIRGSPYDTLKINQTLVNLDGEWLPTIANPGLNMYEKYKPDIYKHSQHNVDYGLYFGNRYKGARSFRRCSKANHHSCLRQYTVDGNFQFSEPAVENFCRNADIC